MKSKELKKLPVKQIINFISEISANFPKSKYVDYIAERISKNTDYSEEMVKTGIKNAFLPYKNKKSLKKLLRYEIYNEKILDEWVKIEKNIYLKAFSPDFIHAIFSGNIPGIETQIIFPALLSKTCIYAKPSYKMHIFFKEFKKYITKNFRKLSNFIEIEVFRGDDEDRLKDFVKDAEIVVVQGSTDTIRNIKRIAGEKRVIDYPTMFGAGFIKRKDFNERILNRVALDIFLYNHRGCMSPFVIFIQKGIDYEELTGIIDKNIKKLKKKFKAKEIDLNERIRRRQVIDTFLFEKDLILKDRDFKFIKTPKIIDLFFPGIIQIVYYKKPDNILEALMPFKNFLQAFAFSSFDKKIIESVAQKTSCIRITEWGRLQFPPLFFANKGSFGIKQFLKFCVIEK